MLGTSTSNTRSPSSSVNTASVYFSEFNVTSLVDTEHTPSDALCARWIDAMMSMWPRCTTRPVTLSERRTS